MPGETDRKPRVGFPGQGGRVKMNESVVTLLRGLSVLLCGLPAAFVASMARIGRRPLMCGGATVCLFVSGCIIPLAPEFEPPGSNLSPYIVSASPPVGSRLNEQEEIVVVLADPNLGDQLFVQWAFNFPEDDRVNIRFAIAETLPAALDGSEVRNRAARIRPLCSRDLVEGLPQHRVMLIVSDRPFIITPDNPFDAVPEDAHVVRANWFIEQECL